MDERPEYFLNRELSWLKFNRRVLDEANDVRNPLLERVRFLAIASSNLDEFFMVRVAGLQQYLASGIDKPDAARLSVHGQLRAIYKSTHAMMSRHYRYWEKLRGLLAEKEIFFPAEGELSDQARKWLEKYFWAAIYPVLTPLAVDKKRQLPFFASRSLNLAVFLINKMREKRMAVIQIPSVLPRLVQIPGTGRKRQFIWLEELIRFQCQHLFPDDTVENVVPFRITRDADIAIADDDADDLLTEVEKSLRLRRRGQAVRLEVGWPCDPALRELLLEKLNIEEQAFFSIKGPLDMTCMLKIADLAGCDFLRYPSFVPHLPADLSEKDDLFAAIRQKDILLHHPYDSFAPVIEFVKQAAFDPYVREIKQTLYRVGGHSSIVKALAQAAQNGKNVTVLMELRARFDEENNILWAKQLEESGCHVIYGLTEFKTHAKIILIIRQEDGVMRRYVHIGTGNYNDKTARQYTDMGIFTADAQIGADAAAFFHWLSEETGRPEWHKLSVAPLNSPH